MNIKKKRQSVAIVGAGISGLTAGFQLQKKNYSVTVFEKNAYPGGVMKSAAKDGWLVEWGPNTVMAKSDTLWDLINQLELTEQVVQPGKEAKKRYVVKNGVPTALPSSLLEFIRTNLISTKAKLRLFKEPFISKSEKPESVADFFERRLGREVLDYAVNPFIAGIYAGDPKKLSVAHTLSKLHEFEQQYGSVVKGAVKSGGRSKSKKSTIRKGLISFKNGVQQLPLGLQKQLGDSIQFNSNVTKIQPADSGWNVERNGTQYSHFDAIIFTAPLHQLGAIDISISDPDALNQLQILRYAPVATVALGFKADQINHPLDGFGILVPEVEPYNILGCLFSSSLFSGRAPENNVLLTCFVGGERSPDLVDLSDEELKLMVLDDLQKLLGCSGKPVFESIHRWQKAIPQYGLDYQQYLDTMDELEKRNPGFYLTGNFREEVSVPGCISNAYETAARVASFLQS